MPLDEKHIRVLHVIDGLGASGGSERQLVNNLQHFSDGCFEHRVAYLVERPHNVAHLVPDDVTAQCVFAADEQRRGALRSAVRLRKVICDWQPDLIHSCLAKASTAARLARFGSRTVMVQTLVGIGYEPERLVDNPHVTRWKLEAYRRLDMLTSSQVRLFHAVSKAVADSWVRTAGVSPDKIRVIPRGVDVEALQSAAKGGVTREALVTTLQIDPRAAVMLAVGRHEAPKGHRYLLEALSLLSRADPPVVLLMAGRQGNVTNMLEDVIRARHLEKTVRVLGYRDDVPALLAAADLFVFPSVHEGMPGALLEAMALGRPCIAAAIKPVLEVMSDGVEGVVVPPRDPQALAGAIAELVADKERGRVLGVAAEERVRTAFSAQVAADRLELLYREALGAALCTA